MMNIPSSIQQLQRRIGEVRVENANVKKFVPESELYNIMSNDVVEAIVFDVIPSYYRHEVVGFIMKGACKVFGILVLINFAGHIKSFIKSDELQERHVDNLLPFPKPMLQGILQDEYIVSQFFEKQWEFSAPVFSGRIIPRALGRETILPYLEDTKLADGGNSAVYKIKIHQSHQPKGYDAEATVCGYDRLHGLSD
jgi:hypothetical protein